MWLSPLLPQILKDSLSIDWDLNEIGSVAMGEFDAVPTVRVLTWRIIEDNLPFYVEECVLLLA